MVGRLGPSESSDFGNHWGSKFSDTDIVARNTTSKSVSDRVGGWPRPFNRWQKI